MVHSHYSYGFEKIERDFKKAVPDFKSPSPLLAFDLPSSEFANDVLSYVKEELNPETLNHSLRVFLYSRAIIIDQFPQWKLDEEILFVTALFHDIGTTEKNLRGTKLSFEYYGGLIARNYILSKKNSTDYADAVAEAVFRHQDLNDKGYITQLGLILQISTVIDNVGLENVLRLIHPNTLKSVNAKYPRKDWLNCFARVVDEENKLKPWAHTTSLGNPDFRNNVLNNQTQYQ